MHRKHIHCYCQQQDLSLNVGDILLIPPNMLHKIICQEEGTRFIFLINIDSFSNLEDYHTLDPVFMDAYYCSAITKPSIYQEFYANLMQMIDTYFSNDIFWETTIFSLLLKSCILIGKEQYDQSVTQADTDNINKHREHYDKFVSLLTFIDANYQEDLSLEQAADYIGFSKYHFHVYLSSIQIQLFMIICLTKEYRLRSLFLQPTFRSRTLHSRQVLII